MAAKRMRTSSGWRADLVVSCLLQDENHTMVVDDMKVKDETRMRVDINAGYLQTRHRLHHLKKASIGAGDDHLLHVAEAPAPAHSVHSALGPCSKVEIVEVAVDQVGLVCHLPGLHHWGGGLRLC